MDLGRLGINHPFSVGVNRDRRFLPLIAARHPAPSPINGMRRWRSSSSVAFGSIPVPGP
jgi:hypothetical protein